MHTILFSSSQSVHSELSLLLRCRWEDARVILAQGEDNPHDSVKTTDLIFFDLDSHPHHFSHLILGLSQRWHGPIIALSRRSIRTEDLVLTLRSGADDVWEDFPPDTMLFIARIQALIRRVQGGGWIRLGRLTLYPEMYEARADGRWLLPLTPTEFRLLHVLANNRGRVVPFEELIEAVWLDELVSDATIRKVIQRLRSKLADRAGVEISSRPGIGYMIRETEAWNGDGSQLVEIAPHDQWQRSAG